MKKICASYLTLQLAAFCYAGKYHPAIQYIFPLPNSKMLPVKVTVILRLEPSCHSQITDLEDLIRVEGDSAGVYSGTVFLATDDKTVIFKPEHNFIVGEKIEVTIRTSQMQETDFQYEFDIDRHQSQLPVSKTKIESNNQIDSHIHEISLPRIINGVTVPSDFPWITTSQKLETAPGKLFFGTNVPNPGTGNYLIICENDGTPYFYRRYNQAERSVGFERQPLGVLTVHFGGPEHFIVLDSHFVQIDTYTCGHGYITDNHELRLLENGHALIIAQEDIKIDMSAIISGGHPNAVVEGNHIQELDKNKNVIFEWRSWDYFNILDAIGIDLEEKYIDYAHINSIAVDYDGNLIISTRNLCEVTKIDRQTGDIIWRFGGNHNQFAFIDDTDEIWYQHDARPVPEKAGQYTIFDNGKKENRPYSRAVEYHLDTVNMTAEKVWEYRYTPDRFSKSMGSTQRLTNGNTVIDWPKNNMRVCEVTPSGELIYEIFSQDHTNYRCRRYEWEGRQKQPYLIVDNFGSIIRLIFNQFGDADVQYYNIYYGMDENQAILLDSTRETYYDAAYLRNGTRYSFRVTAVDDQQHESDFSNVEHAFVQTNERRQNLLKNGNFISLQYWMLSTSAEANATATVDPNMPLEIDISEGGAYLDDIQLSQDQILLIQDREYVLEFDAYANTDYRFLRTTIEGNTPIKDDYARIGVSALRKRPQHYQFPFRMELPSDSDARLVFHCGADTSNIFIDNVSLTYADESIDTALKTLIRINFQPLEFSPPENYHRDSGEIFGTRPSGYNYGWLGTVNEGTTSRESLLDPRYTTFNHMQTNDTSRIWEIQLPNGHYEVHLVTGDPDFTDQANHIQIEDLVLADPDGYDHFDAYTASVEVDDGRLTLKPTPDSENLKICFIDIDNRTTGVETQSVTVPYGTMLMQNFPNPFNSSTNITFFLSRHSDVQVHIFDTLGRLTKTLVKKKMTPGQYSVKWDGTDDSGRCVSSGIYFLRLTTNHFHDMKKCILLQ